MKGSNTGRLTVIFGLMLVSSLLSNTQGCDCDYHSGGCIISSPPDGGFKCHCVYKGFYTCSGHQVQCGNGQNCPANCSNQECCNTGGGDCGGY